MKPFLRTSKVQGQSKVLEDAIDVEETGAYPLPPEMQGRADAAELRKFIRNFQKISDPDDRRAIMEAVFLASDGEC